MSLVSDSGLLLLSHNSTRLEALCGYLSVLLIWIESVGLSCCGGPHIYVIPETCLNGALSRLLWRGNVDGQRFAWPFLTLRNAHTW